MLLLDLYVLKRESIIHCGSYYGFLFDKYSEVIDKMLYQKWEFSIKDGIGNYGIVTTNKDSIFFHGEDSSFFLSSIITYIIMLVLK